MSYIRRITSLLGIVALLALAGRYIAIKLNIIRGQTSVLIRSIVLVAIIVIFTLAMMRSISYTSTPATVLYRVSGVVITLLLYFLLSLLVVDGVALVTDRSQSLRVLLASIIAVLITGYGIWHAYDTKIVHQTITIPGLTQPIIAVHLTDTHFGHTRGEAEARKLIRMIQDIHPDVIFFTGDMFDSPRALSSQVFDIFAQLSIPLYFVEGNHDVHVGAQPIKDAMRDHGAIVLENEIAQFGELTIIGLNHMAADIHTRNVHVADMTHTVQSVLHDLSVDPTQPTVLLHHSPDGLDHADRAGVDLFLAGHTHAGQLFPFISLAKHLFTYNRGHYTIGGMDAYICSGTGTFGPAIRVGTRSEICVLELVPKSN